MPSNKIEEVKTLPLEMLSLDVNVGEENSETLINLIADSENMEDDIIKKIEFQELLTTLEETLTERELKILIYRFGIDDGKAKTLEDIGKILEITRERVRQVETKALYKMRQQLTKKSKTKQNSNKNRRFVYKNDKKLKK